jgi:hypothetical protein
MGQLMHGDRRWCRRGCLAVSGVDHAQVDAAHMLTVLGVACCGPEQRRTSCAGRQHSNAALPAGRGPAVVAKGMALGLPL